MTIDRYTSYEQLPLFLSIEDIMSILSIGRSTAYTLIRCGEIESTRVGRQIRIPKSSLIKHFDSSHI